MKSIEENHVTFNAESKSPVPTSDEVDSDDFKTKVDKDDDDFKDIAENVTSPVPSINVRKARTKVITITLK